MPYKSNLPQVLSRHERATAAGLLAAAAVVENRVKLGLRGGYTSGRFVTGHVIASVNHSEPELGPHGAFILVGTDVMYALYWELGHNNLFTGKFERKEVWMPEFLGSRTEQTEAFARGYARDFGGGGSRSRVAASPRSPDA